MGNLDPSQSFDTMLHLEPFVFRVFLTTGVGFTLVFNFDFVSELLPNHKSIHISGLKFLKNLSLIVILPEVIFAFESEIVTGRGEGE